MAERISGLSISLDLETAQVDRSLSQIKNSFSSLRKSAQVNMNNIKFGSKDITTYKKNVDELTKSYERQKQNVDDVKRRMDNMKAAGDDNTEAFKRLNGEYNRQVDELNKLGHALDGAKDKMRDLYVEQSNFTKAGHAFDTAGSHVQSFGGEVQKVGGGLTKWITAPILGAITAAGGLTTALGWKRLVGIDNARAQLKGMGYDAEDVGRITDQVSEAVQGGMMTVAEGTSAAAGAMAAGVEEGEELQKYLKLIDAGAVGMNRSVSETAMIFNRVQGSGKLMTQELNMIEESMPGFSSKLAEHLQVGPEEMRKMVTAGEVTSEDFLTVMDGMAGGMAEAYSDTWSGMVQNTLANIGILGQSLMGGVFEQSKEAIGEFLDLLRSDAWRSWAAEAGETIGQVFTNIVDKVRTGVEWFTNLSTEQKKLVGIFGAVAVAAGPLLTVFGGITIFVGKVISALSPLFLNLGKLAGSFKAVRAGVMTFGTAFPKLAGLIGILTGPIGITVAAIAALGAGFVLAYNKSESFRVFIKNLKARFMYALDGVLEFKDKMMTTFEGIFAMFRGDWLEGRSILQKLGMSDEQVLAVENGVLKVQRFFHDMKQHINNAFSSISGFFQETLAKIKSFWDSDGQQLMTGISNAVNIIKGIITFAISVISGAITAAMPHIQSIISNTFAIVKTVVSTVWSAIQIIISNGLNIILGLVKIFSGLFTGDWSKMFEGVKQIFNGAINIFIGLSRALMTGVINIIKLLVTGVIERFKMMVALVIGAISGMRTTVQNVISALREAFIQIVTNLSLRAVSIFTSLRTSTQNIIQTLRNTVSNIIQNLRDRFVSIVQNLYNRIRNIFTNLLNAGRSIFNNMRNTIANIISNMRDRVVNTVTNLWTRVRNTFNNLKSGTQEIFNAVKTYLTDKWDGIKSSVTDTASDLWDGVKGTFETMRDGLSNIIDEIVDFIGDMTDGVKKGLNKLIDGVNWVAGKIGMDSIPKIELSTGTTHDQTVNRSVKTTGDGALKDDVIATVGDKGPGNGPGGFRRELIQFPNGKTALTPAKDTKTLLPKGSRVFNGKQTHALMNGVKLSTGTTKNGMFDGFGEAIGNAYSGAKDAVSKGINKVGDAIGDVWDFATNPGKLVDKVLSTFGVNFDFAEGDILGGLMQAMYKKLKESVKSLFTGWLEDSGGGDGSSFTKFPVTTPYSPDKPVPGYPTQFNGGKHFGKDYATPVGTVLTAPNAGKVSELSDHGGGIVAKLLSGKFTQFFLHLQSVLKTGQVKKGEPFAKTGNSGAWTTAAHLHYQVEKGNSPYVTNKNTVDPDEYLAGKGGASGGSKAAGAWRPQVIAALKKNGLPTTKAYQDAWIKQIDTESGGNAGITQQIQDINSGGNEARGLVQVIPPTFNAYKLPGHGNIMNGLDNLMAGMNYAKNRYGASGMLSRIGKGIGYAKGGLLQKEGFFYGAEGNQEEMIIPLNRPTEAMKLMALAAKKIGGEGKKTSQLPNVPRGNDHDLSVLEDKLDKMIQLMQLLLEKDQDIKLNGRSVKEEMDQYDYDDEMIQRLLKGRKKGVPAT